MFNRKNTIQCKTPKSQRDILEEGQNSDDDLEVLPKSLQMNVEHDLVSHVERVIGIGKRIKEYITAEDIYEKNKGLLNG
jgi:hypothetical protein